MNIYVLGTGLLPKRSGMEYLIHNLSQVFSSTSTMSPSSPRGRRGLTSVSHTTAGSPATVCRRAVKGVRDSPRSHLQIARGENIDVPLST